MLGDVEDNGYQFVCSAGYAASATDLETNLVTECSDIDECADETHNYENATYTNNDGVFTCACDADWNTNENGQAGTYHIVNECSEAVNSNTCGANSNCVDNDGSYCHCLPSFHMVEGACVDDDECATNNNDCHASRSAV